MSAQESTEPRTVIRAVPPLALLRADTQDGSDGAEDPRPLYYGTFARFNEWTEIDSWFEGHFLESIAPGAFRKTFRERAADIRVLFQHGRDAMVGDKPIGEPQLMEERDEGAYHETRLFDGLPPLIIDGLRAGQYGQSFRMEILREERKEEPGVSDHNPQGLPEVTIKEIRLHEFGPVTFPAYANTTAGLRSMTDDFVFGWIKRHPQQARSLLTDELQATALRSQTPQDAPSDADAGHTATSVTGRRANRAYGLDNVPERPAWVL
jgi:HK97 family phage prohead protease